MGKQYKFIQERSDNFFSEINDQLPELSIKARGRLATLVGYSDFISRHLYRHPEWINLVLDAIDNKEVKYTELLAEQLKSTTQVEQLYKILRTFRHFHMLCIGARDLLNTQDIESSLKQVSSLADSLIMGAYNWLYSDFCRKHGTPEGEYGPQPLIIHAMGKLGGKELNFSSDIDLIFTFPAKGTTQGGKKPLEHQQFFIRLAQQLIAALNKITDEGQVFRVDMRLRPFGESGPLAMHFAAFEDYYQDQGRHWERFAMLKARILNPPSPYTEQLELILKPFVFRRYLDFTTLDALRDMKQLIAREIRRRQLADNIKLGAGGIREVEFFAQSFQLIHGGREPSLQCKSLKTALFALVELDIVEKEIVERLYQDYLWLRKTEHTLQQLDDQQTQTLPEKEWQLQVVSEVMQVASIDDFKRQLTDVMAHVHKQFNDLIEETHESHSDDDSLFNKCRDCWRMPLEEDEFVALFKNHLSAIESRGIYKQLVDFNARARGFRLGQRGEDSLKKLMPEVLYVLVDQHPARSDKVLSAVLQVVNAVLGRTTYLDLLLENPDVLHQLVSLCSRSSWIANQIRHFPLLLDELLSPVYLQKQCISLDDTRIEHADELRQHLLRIDPEDIEQWMEAVRQFKLCQQLRIAASDINGSLPVSSVSDKLTVLAEVCINSVFQKAWQQITAKYGTPEHLKDEDTGFAIIGYGKLGGYELGYGSDLDLVFLHNAPRQTQTNGPKRIGSTQFYIKLAQRIMHFLTTTTLFGRLYDTDLRLRPSGDAGLMSCHIDGFESYQQNDAWTWEHQALVRARVVLGGAELSARFSAIRQSILEKHREKEQLKNEVVKMRKKMRDHLLKKNTVQIDLKQCEGGITDIEFLTQYWVLSFSHQFPKIAQYTDNLRVLDTIAKEHIVEAEVTDSLKSAYLSLRAEYHQLTLSGNHLADDTQELESLRKTVSNIWNDVMQSTT
ncbi:bifunctional [glutamate--ammonia ligase]-adenylyl-L-tyrosine phosphorylase/[glutamate--ammonia-ligase] adenylyltransferase [Alteromonas sp. ASW11-130]|uniref:bifunctional [glutamate--ammonia ligase]-adenylyl-L-tyrosine phosphorylase/[glutamate--ammonia-ligase] adenylyltransferase n=1 Tax=Alteromonas sp. ASW11-130 TaxID=3015775 RepID=UPI002242506D|nr:bifunctional [glutamate--ammonia ligase]-adenylyl-L-tyrosine phosphorylase/[glutamate--ammonia-ligase] adenylyltransferase [Alteromonas sp. ASW11-130]MCW8091257.1 bifunctional [glutamate--ammonia ligase]-adenylyl-L-tyrosine phosphorylase/[glutamate--ammonia-ligase] adenylyltransferase [Alteromonas sp. ASW11-130]